MRRALLIVIALLVVAPAGRAEEPRRLLDGWTFRIVPYLWLPAIDGTGVIRGVRQKIDVSIGDSLDLVGDGLSLLAAYSHFEARRERFFMNLNVSLLRLDTDDDVRIPLEAPVAARASLETKARSDAAYVTGLIGHRLMELVFPGRPRTGTIDAFVGVRYYYMWTQLRVKGRASADLGGPIGTVRKNFRGRDSGTVDFVDPLLGARFSLPILDAVDLSWRGSIGGFGAGSDLVWDLAGHLVYHPSWRLGEARPMVLVGYRVLDIDYEGPAQNEFRLNLRGPVTGVGLTF